MDWPNAVVGGMTATWLIRSPVGSSNSIMSRQRLDNALVARGLAESRSRAQDMIRLGDVRIGGKVVTRPALPVSADAPIEIADGVGRYVSRGALKLRHALDHFRLEAAGRCAIDIGASTGGFTELLLERGAERVYAVDVGRGQLHPRLRADPRVVNLERTDARRLDRVLIPAAVTAVVVDASFISATLVLPPALALTGPGCWLVTLVKPQFEAGREAVGKGGIVRDERARGAAVERVAGFLAGQPGWRLAGVTASPIEGGDGNQEFLLGACRDA